MIDNIVKARDLLRMEPVLGVIVQTGANVFLNSSFVPNLSIVLLVRVKVFDFQRHIQFHFAANLGQFTARFW